MELTMREIFAKDAPNMPDWFEHKSRLEKPKEPSDWIAIKDEKDQSDCRSWHYDPCYDLANHLQWYQQNWEKYKADMVEYNQAVISEKYFAWRLYFADQLLKELSLSSIPEN